MQETIALLAMQLTLFSKLLRCVQEAVTHFAKKKKLVFVSVKIFFNACLVVSGSNVVYHIDVYGISASFLK